MEDMAKHPRLHKRGNVYYARVAVPRDIKASFGKPEIWRSLKTTDFREAVHRLRTEADPECEKLFADHREELARLAAPPLEELTDAQLRAVGDAYFVHLLEEDDELRESGFEGEDFEAVADDVEAMDELNREEFARGIQSEFIRDEARDVLSWSSVNLRLSDGSPSWPKVIRAIYAARIKAASVRKQRNNGELIETPVSTVPVSAAAQPKLSEVVTEWSRERTAAKGGWVASTAKMNLLWAARFIEMSGDKPADKYSKDDARTFKQALLSLPPNWTKDKRLKDLKMREAVAKAQQIGIAPMSLRNANKIIGFVAALFNFAIANYDVSSNPFTGLKVRISGKVRDERHPFTLGELKALFASPLFTGCKSLRYHNSHGSMILKDSGVYWVPLLGLFTGARSGEIIQLRLEDVGEHEEISYISITDEGAEQNVKNAGSVRLIPIHQTLKDIGFLSFVERQRKRKTGRLFPEMPKSKDGYYSSAYSRPFANTLKTLKIKHERNAFHSFRHSFEDACRNSRIPAEFMNALQGHREGGMAGRYGNALIDLPLLKEEMDKLAYRGLAIPEIIT